MSLETCCHLVMQSYITTRQCHLISDGIAMLIAGLLLRAQINVHVVRVIKLSFHLKGAMIGFEERHCVEALPRVEKGDRRTRVW